MSFSPIEVVVNSIPHGARLAEAELQSIVSWREVLQIWTIHRLSWIHVLADQELTFVLLDVGG